MDIPPESRRRLSLLEVLLGAGLVLGHNLFRVLPNEVPFLALLGLASLRLRSGSFRAAGFQRPVSWNRTLGLAAAAAALRLFLGAAVIEPLGQRFGFVSAEPPGLGLDRLHGNLPLALGLLAFVWAFAAFGEEIAYRGYLTRRLLDLVPGAPWVAVGVGALLFGLGHAYKGPLGVLDSGVAGLILGALYLRSGRNLWAPILAHGFIDSLGIAQLYFGLG